MVFFLLRKGWVGMKKISEYFTSKDGNDKKITEALEWFLENNCDENMKYTPKNDNGIPLLSPAQGIFKQKDSVYATSIKQTLKGIYADREPYYFSDHSWIYVYHQRGDSSISDRDSISDNKAIVKNLEDKIPLGVLIQNKSKGRDGARYKVGIGIPIGWVAGFFIVYCANEKGEIDPDVLSKSPNQLFDMAFLSQYQSENEFLIEEAEEVYDPSGIEDTREKNLTASGHKREGQSKFKTDLMIAYKGTCAITGCNTPSVLEAAHITPYKGLETNKVQNGLLLRADIHKLWDHYLLTIEVETNKLILDTSLLSDSNYSYLQGKIIDFSAKGKNRPSKKALKSHNDSCNF